MYVGRGRTQLARQLLAMQHPPGNLERSPEQPLGQDKIGGGQGIADLGAADANTVQLDGLRSFHGKALNDAGLLQEIEIANAVTAEA